MATILDFHRISGPAVSALNCDAQLAPADRKRPPLDEERDDYWPEVSSGLWVADGNCDPRPENAPGRVLSEIGLILGVAALLVILTTVLLGGPV